MKEDVQSFLNLKDGKQRTLAVCHLLRFIFFVVVLWAPNTTEDRGEWKRIALQRNPHIQELM
jgi:hypothetical protein